jgi:hypothetical protein
MKHSLSLGGTQRQPRRAGPLVIAFPQTCSPAARARSLATEGSL